MPVQVLTAFLNCIDRKDSEQSNQHDDDCFHFRPPYLCKIGNAREFTADIVCSPASRDAHGVPFLLLADAYAPILQGSDQILRGVTIEFGRAESDRLDDVRVLKRQAQRRCRHNCKWYGYAGLQVPFFSFVYPISLTRDI